MKKRYCAIVFIAALLLVFFNVTVYAQKSYSESEDRVNDIRPILSENSLSEVYFFNESYQNSNNLLATNTQTQFLVKKPEAKDIDSDEDADGEVDEDLFDEYLFDDFEANNQDIDKVHAISDPLYYFNYFMYRFNDTVYFAVLKPVASGYKALTPSFMHKSVYNFFHNLIFPVRFVNNLLQGKVKQAVTEVEIFLINSTIGVAGFSQVAQHIFNLNTLDEDFGQTLGAYSIGDGFYLVLPIFGPSTLRDSIGIAVDSFLDPLSYVAPLELAYGLKACDSINGTALRLGDYETFKKAAFDPYIALRDAYLQIRKEKINN